MDFIADIPWWTPFAAMIVGLSLALILDRVR